MKRHESFRALSREHHQALVLARMLRADTPSDLRAALPANAAARVRYVQERFARELAPHFAVEERELLALSECADDAVREHARHVQAQHVEIRARYGALAPEDFEAQADALGELLEAHVRFEERSWFPALEATLDAGALQVLARRVSLEPRSLISGYHQDEAGVWVAELDCGHARHVRHQPPFQLAAWVTTPESRAERLGSEMECRFCRMPRLPACAQVYKSTALFDVASVPAGLLRTHRTAVGTWGRIVVEEGRVEYVLEDEAGLSLILRPGVPGIVGPTRPHHVALQDGARFHVEFLRRPTR